MVGLILRLDPHQNQNRVVLARFLHLHRLKPTLQRRILLDVLPVLVQRRRPHTLQLPTAQRRLDDVARIHRPFRRPRTHNRVQFVNEQNHVLVPPDLIHHRLDPLLKLPAVLRPRHHQRQIQRDHFLVPQDLRHVPNHNLLRQSFHNRRLAHPSLTNQHRIVLRPAAQDLNHALNLIRTPNHRVHLPLRGNLRQIPPKRLQRRRLPFLPATLAPRLRRTTGFLESFVFRLAFLRREIRIEFLQNLVPRPLNVHLKALQHLRRHTLTLTQQSQQDVLRPHITVIQRTRLFTRQRQHLLHPRRVRNVPHHLLLLSAPHLLLHFHPHGLKIQPQLLQDVDSNTLPQLDEAEQKMLSPHIVVIEAVRLLAGKG